MCFRAKVALPARDLAAMIAALDEVAGDTLALPSAIVSGVRAAAGELRSALSAGAGPEAGRSGGMRECPKERALDVAALLLDAATGLQQAGCHVAAFALEGVEGRLLEALVTGAG